MKSEEDIIIEEGKLIQIFNLEGFGDLLDEEKKWEVIDFKIVVDVPSFICQICR